MSDTNLQNFDKRMEKLIRKHQRLARGYVPKITEDGLIVAQPRSRLRLPWRPVLSVLVLAYAVKIALFSVLGAETYERTVAGLATGTQLEQVGAWVLSADPATVAVAEQISALLN